MGIGSLGLQGALTLVFRPLHGPGGRDHRCPGDCWDPAHGSPSWLRLNVPVPGGSRFLQTQRARRSPGGGVGWRVHRSGCHTAVLSELPLSTLGFEWHALPKHHPNRGREGSGRHAQRGSHEENLPARGPASAVIAQRQRPLVRHSRPPHSPKRQVASWSPGHWRSLRRSRSQSRIRGPLQNARPELQFYSLGTSCKGHS